MNPNPEPNADELDVLEEHFSFWDQEDETYVNGGWLTKASKQRIRAKLQARDRTRTVALLNEVEEAIEIDHEGQARSVSTAKVRTAIARLKDKYGG